MGVAVSNWRLARSVAQLGQLGVVSGTLLSVVFARRLQSGDPGGHMNEALERFPIRAIAERVRNAFFVPGGKPADAPFKPVSMPGIQPSRALAELTVVANFAEVHLAKRGHNNPVGINLLEKIQIGTLTALYGAMLAGVDYVLMGAGIPREIPGALDRFAAGQPAEIAIDVAGAVAGSVNIKKASFTGRLDMRLIEVETGEILGSWKDEDKVADMGVKVAGTGTELDYNEELVNKVFEPIVSRMTPKIVRIVSQEGSEE